MYNTCFELARYALLTPKCPASCPSADTYSAKISTSVNGPWPQAVISFVRQCAAASTSWTCSAQW